MEWINLKEQEYLFDFFINYDHATPEARGYDSTVVLPNNDRIKCAITIVPEFKKEDTFLAVKLSGNWYIIRAPRPQPDIPVGHWTHSLFAYDTQYQCRALLKDFWCVLMKGIEPEGVIYEKLY
jgi:hypothetical protein